jgi:hypothetical protein
MVIIGEDTIKLYPVKIRYVWPSEMDLMAELARLKLFERWGGWDKQLFTSSSPSHISVYTPSPSLAKTKVGSSTSRGYV